MLLQDYMYLYTILSVQKNKKQRPFVASYKQSVQVDTSFSSTEAESNIALLRTSRILSRKTCQHGDWVCSEHECSDRHIKVSLWSKASLSSSETCVSNSPLSSMCVCVHVGIAAHCLSTTSVRIQLDFGFVLETFARVLIESLCQSARICLQSCNAPRQKTSLGNR